MSLPTNDADWEIECGTVVRAMQSFVAPYVTPISKVISDDEGRLLGTGSYIEMLGQRLLITNEHNVKALETHSLGLQLHGNDGVFKLHNSAPGLALPVDCAYSLISDHIWSTQAELQPHQARAVPGSRIAIAHMPVENELLFFRGYAGENSKFYFDTLLSTATSYLTRETPLLAGWGNARFHFALHYPPTKAISLDPRFTLPVPKGFSGSLVWNTRYVECVTQGIPWSPEEAQVTGIVWGWPPETASILCTRVEYLRSFLTTALAVMQQRGEISVAQ